MACKTSMVGNTNRWKNRISGCTANGAVERRGGNWLKSARDQSQKLDWTKSRFLAVKWLGVLGGRKNLESRKQGGKRSII